MLVDVEAGVRMTIGEAHTNMASCYIGGKTKATFAIGQTGCGQQSFLAKGTSTARGNGGKNFLIDFEKQPTVERTAARCR
jgi:hypothetical protein